MKHIDIIIPTLTTIIGIAITTLVVVHQNTLQRRLGYLTSMLEDDETMKWYKTFLKIYAFIYERLEVFPKLQIQKEDLELAHQSENTSQKLEYLITYIRHVLQSVDRLRSKFPELATQTEKHYDPQYIFTTEYRLMIIEFTNSIVKGLTFHPARPWFIALFSPAENRYKRLITLINDRNLTLSQKRIVDIEFEVREFMLGKW